MSLLSCGRTQLTTLRCRRPQQSQRRSSEPCRQSMATLQTANVTISVWLAPKQYWRCVQAAKFRRDVTAARAEAEFHVKASAAIVASAIDAAPKVAMLPELPPQRCCLRTRF